MLSVSRVCTVLLLVLLACAASFGEAHLYYTGTIGKLAVQMDLRFLGDGAEGTYWYESSAKPYDAMGLLRNQLYLQGTLAGGRMALTEKEHTEGPATGRFSGTLSADATKFTGTWERPDGTHDLPVTLQAVARYLTVSQKDEKRNIECTASYPRFLALGMPSADLDAYLNARC